MMGQRKRTVLIVDDEQYALDYLVRLVNAREDLSLVFATTEGEKAKLYTEQYGVDIAVVDLDLRTMEGYEIMAGLNKDTQIIVCTASENEGSIAMDKGAVDFLSRPFDDERFNRAADRALERLQLLKQLPPVDLPTAAKLPNIDRSAIHLIRWDEIVYIRSHGKVTTIFRTDGQVFRCGYMLRQIEGIMPSYFLRIHRSFLLNLNEIECYSHRLSDRKVYIKKYFQSLWREGTDPEKRGESDGGLPVGYTYVERLAKELGLDL